MGKNQSLKVKNNLLQLEKDFTEQEDIELNYRGEVKIKREIKELLSNQLLCLQMIRISLNKKK